MKPLYQDFLQILSEASCGQKLSQDPALSAEDWQTLLALASEHELLPLVYDAVCGLPSFRTVEASVRKSYQEKAVEAAMRQVVQTNEFLTMLLHLQDKGLDPVVLKGLVCRNLYPMPMLRPSVDEDLLIDPKDKPAFHEALLAEGLTLDEGLSPADDDLSYHRADSPTYIELHASPFPVDADAYASCNALFAESLDRSVRLQAEDVSVRTLCPDDHVLFLICHAYKHFLHSGVGIRQVLDLALMVNACYDVLHWDYLYEQCRRISIDTFTAAILQIGTRYFHMQQPLEPWNLKKVDAAALLDDILSGGVYGMTDVNRAHSATITLNAVRADRNGDANRRLHLRRSLFPSRKTMVRRYEFVNRFPVLLPWAWMLRILQYVKRNLRSRNRLNAGESLRIGSTRVELFKQYGIISKKDS